MIGETGIVLESPVSWTTREPTHPTNTMKHPLNFIAAAALALGLTNCAQQMGPNTQRGAATGGLIGAGAGAIIGHQSGNTLGGALIGGAAGATAGGLYGNQRDKEQGY